MQQSNMGLLGSAALCCSLRNNDECMHLTCNRVRTSAKGYEANWAMELDIMPAPRMAKGGGSPSYLCSRCSLKISNAAMSTPANGMMPSCRSSPES